MWILWKQTSVKYQRHSRSFENDLRLSNSKELWQLSLPRWSGTSFLFPLSQYTASVWQQELSSCTTFLATKLSHYTEVRPGLVQNLQGFGGLRESRLIVLFPEAGNVRSLSCKILLSLWLSQVLRGNREFVFLAPPRSGPPGTNLLAYLDPGGLNPLADLFPLREFGPDTRTRSARSGKLEEKTFR